MGGLYTFTPFSYVGQNLTVKWRVVLQCLLHRTAGFLGAALLLLVKRLCATVCWWH